MIPLSKSQKRFLFKSTGYDDEQGIFEGYASVFGNIDSDGDVIEKGAFRKTLAEGVASGGVLILAQHEDRDEPLGKSLSLEEDDHGLKIKGYISPTRKGMDYRLLLKDGVIDAMSIGLAVTNDYRGDDGARHITGAELFEVSLVNIPANDQARIQRYKSQKQGGTPMFELKDYSTEDLAELAALVQEEIAEREGTVQASADPADEEKSGAPANGDSTDVDEQLGTKTARQPARANKAATTIGDFQRKYSGIFAPAASATTREDEDKLPKGIGFARSIKCLAMSKGDPDRAADYARKNYGNAKLTRELKALSVTSPTAGGFLVPETYASEVIPLLTAKTIVKQLGATILPMDTGNLTIPKMTGGAMAGYVGELRPGKTTKQEFGNIRLSAKKLMTIVPISNDLLRSNSYSADQIILDDVTKNMARKQDEAALIGKGTEFQPKGLMNISAIERLNLGAAGLSTLGTMFAAMLKKNANMDRLGWAINPFGWEKFYNVANDLGVFPLRDQMDNGKLLGYSFETSTLLPNGGNNIPVILGNWSDLLIGEQTQLEVQTSVDASFTDDNGNVVSSFQSDAQLLRVISLHDMAVRYTESFVIGLLSLT